MNSPADNYWPEPCAACDGTGLYKLNLEALSARHRELVVEQSAAHRTRCLVCGGKAFVLVLQPAEKCHHCSGTGRTLAMRCDRCKGTGWMFVLKEPGGFSRYAR